MNKQTAVDWLITEITKNAWYDEEGFAHVSLSSLNFEFIVAKDIEKEQMKDAVLDNVTKHEGMRKLFREQFEKYYNKTFNNK